MKCCKCSVELDVKKREVPPKWFGSYYCDRLLRVICAKCIKKPENDGWWK